MTIITIKLFNINPTFAASIYEKSWTAMAWTSSQQSLAGANDSKGLRLSGIQLCRPTSSTFNTPHPKLDMKLRMKLNAKQLCFKTRCPNGRSIHVSPKRYVQLFPLQYPVTWQKTQMIATTARLHSASPSLQRPPLLSNHLPPAVISVLGRMPTPHCRAGVLAESGAC